MAIQWFPGHMTTARKKAAETMAQIDVVVEVSPRRPEAGSNPTIHELLASPALRSRPLNKADSLTREATASPIISTAARRAGGGDLRQETADEACRAGAGWRHTATIPSSRCG
jgi:ribosome biogenesis GTPase A